MESVPSKTCITTSAAETGIASVSLPAAVNLSDEAAPYISSQLPRYLHAGDFILFFNETNHHLEAVNFSSIFQICKKKYRCMQTP